VKIMIQDSGFGIRAVLAIALMLALAAPAWAALDKEVGTFALDTGSSTTTVSTSFQGKAVLLWTDCKTAAGESAGACFGVGFADGTNLVTISGAGDDSASTTNVGRAMQTNNALRVFTDGAPTTMTGGQVTGVAFNSTPNMVLTMSGTPAAAVLVHYLLLGGDEVTNVYVGSIAMPTGGGTLNVTDPGFQGDFVLGLAANAGSGGTSVNILCSFGAAAVVSGPTVHQWAFSGGVADGATASAEVNGTSKLRDDAFTIGQNTNVTDNWVGSFTGFTASGFDINFTDAPSAAHLLLYMDIQGGQWDVGTQAKPATASTQTITGIPFTPTLLGYFLSSPTALDTYTSNNILTLGATDGTNEAYAGSYHNDAINTVALTGNSNAAISHELNSSAVGTFGGFGSGTADIDWDAPGTAFYSAWFAGASNAASAGACGISGPGEGGMSCQ
jgi:hypothetical protein